MFGSAFEDRIHPSILKKTLGDKPEFINMVDWSNFVGIPGRVTFMDYIAQLEKPGYRSIHQISQENTNNRVPTEYITPCNHWTIKGQYKVAEYLYNEIQKRGLA
jgi:hypothetical protein